MNSGTLTLGADAFSMVVSQRIVCSGPLGSVDTAEALTFAGGLTIDGSRSLMLHTITGPSGASSDYPAALDDSTITVTLPIGPVGVVASVALAFNGRTTGFGYPTATSRPN